MTELERAVALQPADPVLNDHLGDAYWRVGRKLEATFQWHHARDLKPDQDVLDKVLEKLSNGLPEEKPRAMASLSTDVASAATDATPADGPKVDAAPAAEEPKQAAAAASVQGESYKVGPGQSLWSIAVELLGSGSRYEEILDLNPSLGRNPNLIYPGQELKLP